jgi:amino acid transporter
VTTTGDEARAVLPSVEQVAQVLPEPLSYRWKKRLLGDPLITERLSEERLGNVTALGVLAPDCISSTAYGTEEMLNQLVRFVGVAAFSLLLPITGAVLLVLFFVTLSYREVVMVYTKAGGSYVVTRENFGPRVAQIAAVALIIDYIVTVAVQTSAGTDALSSAFPALASTPRTVIVTVGVVVLLTYGNLRGIREAGRTFALPTYLFISAVGSLVIIGLIRWALGQLHTHSIHHLGVGHVGTPGSGLLLGAGVLYVLRAFANGGSSLTGLEAISNGVANFREPTGRNARRVLVIMSATLGSLVLGVSLLARITHAVPYIHGTPTVLSQEARYVFGYSLVGRVGYFLVQAATMLILYTGANTSFNGFPNLASFVAEDAYLPRQLTRRGHRLVFSNGIIILAVISLALIIITRADLTSLVALYAIGVFTGFTMAGAGMVKHHLTHRAAGWRYKIWVNGFASALSALVVLIFAVTKFTEGAWVVVVAFPVLVFVLIRLHHQYTSETEELEANAARAVVAPVLRRLVALVFVERLDLATARALQYARTLHPDELRAVHFVLDTAVSNDLEEQWIRLGLDRFPLDVIECPDRRLTRASMQIVAETAAGGQTEVSVLLPRRVFESAWRLALHDRTADRIAAYVSQLPNANATIVPYPLGKRRKKLVPWTATATDSYAPGSDAFDEQTETGGSIWRTGRDGRTGRERAATGTTGTAGEGGGPDGAGAGPAAGDQEPTPAGTGGGSGAVGDGHGGGSAAAGGGAAAGGTAAAGGGAIAGGAGAANGAAAAGDEESRSRRLRHPWARETRQSGGRDAKHPWAREAGASRSGAPEPPQSGPQRGQDASPPGTTKISVLRPRQRARVNGRVRSVRVQAGGGVPSVECVLADDSGTILLVFQGRRRVPGIEPGAKLNVEGMVGERSRKLAMMNPLFTIISTADGPEGGSSAPPPPRR